MSRIADAFVRTGQSLPDVDAESWEVETSAAEAHMSGRIPDVISRLPIAREEPRADAHDAIAKPVAWDRMTVPSSSRPASLSAEALAQLDLSAVARRTTVEGTPSRPPASDTRPASLSAVARSAEVEAGPPELAAAIGRIFLSRRGRVRSVVFCSVPGDGATDLAWRAAVLLANESGRKVAFVEDPATRVASACKPSGRGTVVAVDWESYDPLASHRDGAENGSEGVQPNDVLGDRIGDLLPSFDFVIVNATALSSDEVIPLARDVNGVVVLLTENETRITAAETLLQELRSSGAHLLGAILTTRE